MTEYESLGGYTGKILRINLSSGEITHEPVNESLIRDYIGGRGWTSRILWQEVRPETDPLGEDAVLMMAIGPFCGTHHPMSGRMTIAAKSPITGILGDSNVGGHFGAYLKMAGFDALIINGSSNDPVWLWIDNGEVELRKADHLWGKGVYEVEEILKNEVGDPFIKTAVIGQGGENLVRYAAVIVDKGAAAGRTGVGAVMGSKRLKAIAVRGRKDLHVADPERFSQLIWEAHHLADGDPQTSDGRLLGTHRLLALFDGVGDLSSYNYRQGTFEGTEKIRAEAMRETGFLKRGRSCFSCNYYCHRSSSIDDDRYGKTWIGGPEFENVKSLGSLCGCDDLAAILYFNKMANDYGIDTITLGNTLAFCMDAYDLGLISKDDLGVDMTWGNADAMEKMINSIAFREGIGDILAEGLLRASEKIGSGTEDLVVHFKGLEDSSTDKRNDLVGGLWGLTSTRGADHLRACTSHFPNVPLDEAEILFGTKQAVNPQRPEGKGPLIKFNEDRVTTFDALGICKFWWWWSSRWENLNERIRVAAEAYTALTGIEANSDWWAITGERIYNLERAFNCREGIRRKDDVRIPKKYQTEMLSGPMKGKRMTPETTEQLMTDYYEARGWNHDGIPTRSRLEGIGLGDVADGLDTLVISNSEEVSE